MRSGSIRFCGAKAGRGVVSARTRTAAAATSDWSGDSTIRLRGVYLVDEAQIRIQRQFVGAERAGDFKARRHVGKTKVPVLFES